MKRIVISSGHAKKVSGACEIIDEVTKARRVVDRVALELTLLGDFVITYHDDWSSTQSENLERIVSFHNAQERDLDVSVHFNCAGDEPTDRPIGTECLYLTALELAEDVAFGIAANSGLINRGAKYRDDLAFLNGTSETAILIEVCFVDSKPDCNL